MTIEERLKEQADCLEKQKSWKARFDALNMTLFDFCSKSKKLKIYGESNMSRAFNMKMVARKKTVDAVENVFKKLEAKKGK